MVRGTKVSKVINNVAARLAVDCSSKRGEVVSDGLVFKLSVRRCRTCAGSTLCSRLNFTVREGERRV